METKLTFIVLFDKSGDENEPTLRVFDPLMYPRLAKMLSWNADRNAEIGIVELEHQFPDIVHLSNSMQTTCFDRAVLLTVSLIWGRVAGIDSIDHLYSLQIESRFLDEEHETMTRRMPHDLYEEDYVYDV